MARVLGFAVLLGIATVTGVAPATNASAATPTGYVLAAADGGVFAFGRAFHGSAAGFHLRAPIAGIASTPDGAGYWLVASDGGVFAFGSARFFGSMGGVHLAAPIVGIAATPDGAGYWLVASDGGVFAFGSARFFGSLSGLHILAPATAIATTGDGKGYWILTRSGEAFALGDAHATGAPPAVQAPFIESPDYIAITHVPGTLRTFVATSAVARNPFVTGPLGTTATPCGPMSPPTRSHLVGVVAGAGGCKSTLWVAAADGSVFAYGLPFFGSMGGTRLAAPIVGIAG